ncbi:TauD/TfdA family dioxygenase [Aquabacterium sp. A7-Y]|uniref:TauD/TfdA family dioxygenase n=1 Tax=Aquabacterium sp. A7-Y TaxID=1349605 RepID=UPI00223CD0DB|nr:TauD/TfdA family dioxygenase [Aquabacterium sp. A7-Y]MCW7538713.1 TauD/TfdA family dioxygenase [Aquabacterium sp. A7-Y]
MQGFVELKDVSDRQVPVRGRRYLAGSDSQHVPLAISMANEKLLVLRPSSTLGMAEDAAACCRPVVDERLDAAGALLFRGLPLGSRDDFNRFMAALGYTPHSYAGGIAVRAREAGYALLASQEDARITMAPHNEMAYLPAAPRKVFFFCEQAAAQGGEVPINDIRETVRHIPDAILQAFADRGIRYHRHLPRESTATQVGWQETYGVTDAAELETRLQSQGLEYRWTPEQGLQFSQRQPAFRPDPGGGPPLWFNQVTELHSSYWRHHPLFPSDGCEADYPATTTYGDGDPIDPELITFLRAALWRTSRAVQMAPGDVLVLDNTHIQHGRFAYEGQRRHLVSITA